MNGSDAVYWVNAVLVGLFNALPLCLVVTGALCIQFDPCSVFDADPSLIFTVILCYAIGVILLALFLSALVKSGECRVSDAELDVSCLTKPPSAMSLMQLSLFRPRDLAGKLS